MKKSIEYLIRNNKPRVTFSNKKFIASPKDGTKRSVFGDTRSEIEAKIICTGVNHFDISVSDEVIDFDNSIIKFISKDTNSADDAEIFWFKISGVEYVEDGIYGYHVHDDEISYIDSDGHPIDNAGIKEKTAIFHLNRILVPRVDALL